MTQPDPLEALWRADEPPGRDVAFTAGAIARMVAAPRREKMVRRILTGLGLGGAIAGAVLTATLAGQDPWALAILGLALAGGLWAGGRMVLA